MYFSIRLKGTAEIYCTYILHICTSAVSCLHISNGQFLEGQSFFTVPLLIVQHIHTHTKKKKKKKKRLQGSLVPSPGFTKSSHPGVCYTKGKSCRSWAAIFLAVEDDWQNLLSTFPPLQDMYWVFTSLLLLELSHFPIAWAYAYNRNLILPYNIYTNSSNVHLGHTYSISMYQWKSINKTLKITGIWLINEWIDFLIANKYLNLGPIHFIKNTEGTQYHCWIPLPSQGQKPSIWALITIWSDPFSQIYGEGDPTGALWVNNLFQCSTRISAMQNQKQNHYCFKMNTSCHNLHRAWRKLIVCSCKNFSQQHFTHTILNGSSHFFCLSDYIF